jgi:glycosyltransferase involved in cell wall biosynthesis
MRSPDRRPLVSVVIPCHNRAHVLAAAVKSVAACGARLQIVVIDDGSTDQTAEVARGLDVLLVRQPKRGTAAARNRGLRASTGPFVIFLDPDDRLLPGAIDIGVRALLSQPECAMAYGRGVVTGCGGALLAEAEAPIVRSGHHAALLQTNLIWMSALAIFRREAIEQAGAFAEDLDGAADYDLYLRVSRQAAILDHGRHVAVRPRQVPPVIADAERLLRGTLEAMRRNCPDSHTPLHGAWREGYARWQELYGSRLAEEIRQHLRARAFADACHKSLALLSLAPRVFTRALGHGPRARFAQRVENTIAVSPPASNVPSSFI